jgi:hypothetical protein
MEVKKHHFSQKPGRAFPAKKCQKRPITKVTFDPPKSVLNATGFDTPKTPLFDPSPIFVNFGKIPPRSDFRRLRVQKHPKNVKKHPFFDPKFVPIVL